ncbi:hypothetical protein ACQ7AI_08955 [Lactococcus petauri]|uniref:Uncharacterized protein n=1 Tax=Lactococcus garvieae TaxID=1363 RepID=A0A6L2ZXH7_9LACT|nr:MULTISPECIES: hypothetical protein [Lactococcus]GFO52395.1 hypothetical protein ikelab_16700 [Lactococcus garvieae]
MKFQLTSETFDKTVPLKEGSMLIAEFQGTISVETPVTMKILEGTTTVWGTELGLDPYGSSNLLGLVRKSLASNNVSIEDQDEFIEELQNHMTSSQSKAETIQDEVPPVKEEQSEPEPKKKKEKKKTSEKAKKIDSDGSKQTFEAGKKALYAVSGWKVLTITLLLPLVYFTALLVIFMKLKVDNLWVIGGILIASTLVLCWYIANLIKSAQRKVLEKEVTPEVFKYVVYQQLKEKEKLDKKLEVYRAIHGSPEALRLTTPENVQAVHNLVEEIAE